MSHFAHRPTRRESLLEVAGGFVIRYTCFLLQKVRVYYMSTFIRNLSQRLFWDVDPETIDDRAHCRYVIQRVLERGSLDDIRATVAHYTMQFMIAEAQQIRSLDPMTLAFAACLGNVKEETFRCYSSMR